MRRFVSCLAVTLAILSVSFVWRSEELPSYAKLLTGGGVIPANADVAITEANFPDDTFRAYVSSNFDTDEDGTLSDTEIEAATRIYVAGAYDSRGNISSLKGIEYFTALTWLYCEYNQLTALDVSNNTALRELTCYSNYLTTLDLSNNTALTQLDCRQNQLTVLNVRQNTALIVLQCDDNQLTALDVSNNTALTSLNCGFNQLTALDVSNNTALTWLYCEYNQLTALDVSNNTALTSLNCYGNQLTALDVSNNTDLELLYCYVNQLTALDVSNNTALTSLNCHENQLTELDLSNNTALTSLWCFENQLTALDVSKNTALIHLFCDNNQLTALDVSNNTALTELNCYGNQLTALDVSNNTDLELLYCYGNQLTALDVSNNTALTLLWCEGNQLTELNVSNNTALTRLFCSYNQLTALDVSNNTALTELWCFGNQLTALDVSNNTALTELSCYENQLTALDVSNNTALTSLVCSNNQLAALDVSNNTALTELYCHNNQLTELDVSNNTALTELVCSNNQLAALDLSSNTALAWLSCYAQNVSGLNITSSGNTSYPYQLSFSDYMSPDKFPNISDVKGRVAYTDISTVYSEGTAQFASKPAKVTYNYATGYGTQTMNVTISRVALEVAAINAENFPDDTFREYVSRFDTDGNGSLSDEEIEAVTGIYVGTHSSEGNISSLKGIEYFTALEELYCYNNQLTELDVSKNTALRQLECYINQLTALDVSKNTALTRLYCSNNQLAVLDLSNNTALTWLGCFGNQLTELDLSNNNALEELWCYDNQLSKLDVSGCTALMRLGCHNNQLSKLDVSNNTALTQLDCGSNQLTELDVSKNTALMYLHCYNNQLTALDVSKNTALTVLWCYYNQLTVLDVRSCPDVEINCDTGVTIIRSDNAKPEILTDSLPGGITGQSYSEQLQYSGTTPITWTRKGSFPTGLTLNSEGLISGTPKKAGNFTFTVTAKNKHGTFSKKYTVKVIEPVKITTSSLKAGTIEKTYSVTLKAKGTKPITWSTEGLPSGLTINAKTGKISGKPTEYGQFSVNVTASNGAGSVSRTLPLTVKAIAPTLSGSLKKPTLNVAYSSGLKLSKGTAPITWSISGTLPEGLTFDTETGIISGTPTSYAKSGYKITITAKNDAGSKSKRITLKVNGKAPVIKATLPKTATYGQPYSATLKATGSDPITFTVDKLPAGLSLNGDVISGTVTETTKTFKFTVYAENPVKKVKKSFTIKINGIPKSAKETPSENTENESDRETPRDNTDNNAVEPNITDNTENQTQRGNQQTDNQTESQKSGIPEGCVIVAELGTVSRDEAGMYDFDVALSDDVPAGAELIYIANSEKPSDDDEIAEFFDSTGIEITAVPEDRKISVSIWLNPNTIYHPAIAVKH